MTKKYRKKPVIIEAIQWTGKNADDVMNFICESLPVNREVEVFNSKIAIDTLEGTMFASIDDYIIRGVNGEYYPCKPDIFEKTYEEVE